MIFLERGDHETSVRDERRQSQKNKVEYDVLKTTVAKTTNVVYHANDNFLSVGVNQQRRGFVA